MRTSDFSRYAVFFLAACLSACLPACDAAIAQGDDVSEGTFQISDVVPASRTPSNVALWRKAQRMPLSDEACTTAFNIALLHERRGQHRGEKGRRASNGQIVPQRQAWVVEKLG